MTRKQCNVFLCVISVGIILGVALMTAKASHNDLSFAMCKSALMMIGLLALLFFFGLKAQVGEYVILALSAIFGLYLLFADMKYSILDEGAHLDYINHIVEYQELPTTEDFIDVETLIQANGHDLGIVMKNYEAIQGPVYYLVAALLTAGLSLPARFIALRLFGFLLIFVTYFLCRKSMELLYKKDFIKDFELVKYGLCFFVLNPGLILRFVRITNECLAVCLAALLGYMYLKIILEGCTRKRSYAATVVGILIFLTKSTGAYWLGGIFLILIYYKKWRYIIENILLIAIGTAPWFLYNLKIYHALTGMKAHIEIVMPIANPLKGRFDAIGGTVKLFTGFSIAPEVAGTYNQNLLTSFMGQTVCILVDVLLVYSLAIALKFVYESIKKKLHFSYQQDEKKNVAELLGSALITAGILMLAVSTVVTYLDALIGRYIFTMIVPLLILTVFYMEKMQKREKTVLLALGGIYWAGCHTATLVYIFNIALARP